MCRLFGLTAQRPVAATFWLVEAADSLAQQSRSNPDGYGLATFAQDGTPRVEKRPAAAFEDEEFAREAREEVSRVFVAHVRHATVGPPSLLNTHPFEQEGRVFAHHGDIGGLDRLEERLGEHRALVRGDTDSERYFALVTKEIEAHGGDAGAGLAAAAQWIARELPVRSINCILATATGIWALRYPDTHELLMLERQAGGPTGRRYFDGASAAGRIRVRSGPLQEAASVVFASEQMDEDPGWRGLAPGELVHVDADLGVTTRAVL